MYTKVGLVIPCFNEAKRINLLLVKEELTKSSWLNILFVDDGSRDKTLDILYDFCAGYSEKGRCDYLALYTNRGKGEAVRQGMKHLLKEGQCDLIGFWDADMATPIETVKSLVQVFDHNPHRVAVIGSRVQLCGREVKRNIFRHFMHRILVTFLDTLFNMTVYDTQCGAKLFKRDILYKVIDRKFCSQWLFDIEILLRIKNTLHSDFSTWLYEYPVEKWTDIDGSKVKLESFGKAFYDIVKIYILYKKGTI